MNIHASVAQITDAQLRLNFFHGHGQKYGFREEVCQVTVPDPGVLEIGFPTKDSSTAFVSSSRYRNIFTYESLAMPSSAVQVAKRAFLKVLLELAVLYGLVLQSTRDSPVELLDKEYRKVILKCHPDKGAVASEDPSGADCGWQLC